MEKSGSDLLVEGLLVEGVSHLFGVSGSPIMPILDVVYRTPQIRYVQSQNEQFAMFTTNGYSRAARRTGVCMVTRGPGATNCMTGIAQAFYTATPSLLIAAEEGDKYYGLETSLHHNIEGSILFRPVTKLARRIERADRIPESLQTAFRLTSTGRRGPVFLAIPRNVMLEKTEADFIPPEHSRIQRPPRGNPEDIERAAELLLAAKYPVALAGGGLVWAGAQEVLLQIAEFLAMPVAASRGNKGIVPEDHPLALGIVGINAIPYSVETFQKADLLLAVGTAFDEFTTARFSYEVIPRRAKIIQIDLDPAEIGKIYPVEVGIQGDARSTLQELLQELKRRRPGQKAWMEEPRVRELLQRKSEWEAKVRPMRNSSKVPIQRFRLMHDLRQALPRDVLVTGESGSTHQWFEYAFPATVHTTQIGGWHPMGSEYCEALGAQLALPEKRIVCITGDGSIMMSLQELATAVTYNIPVICVVSHNNIFGNMYYSQMRRFGGRFIGTEISVPNLANVAREFGAFGVRVEEPTQIIPAVRDALDSGKPALLDVILDTSPENLAIPSSLTQAGHRGKEEKALSSRGEQ
ncbi:MAG: thiamine pyrophosphate-binding protein [Deltaproteobacteria bacterium]|nr:thiamine pyrophosphate-binding protein [Deltaproteobacteria bacterium]